MEISCLPAGRHSRMMLSGELSRRLGEFEEARAHFEKLRQNPTCTSNMCQPYVDQQLELIDAKNGAPTWLEFK